MKMTTFEWIACLLLGISCLILLVELGKYAFNEFHEWWLEKRGR